MEGSRKKKVVFVIGSTGSGKSKLAIDIAVRFDGEIINCDKIQVYRGLPIVTNRMTEEETLGIPHHLIDFVDPELDYTAADFRRDANDNVYSILARGHLPIVAGGSNSFVEELVEGNGGEFKAKYSCCFLWVDVSFPVLFPRLETRIDRMLDVGLLEEVEEVFDHGAGAGDHEEDYYNIGIRCAIGVPELHRYLMVVSGCDEEDDEDSKNKRSLLFEKAIEEMKQNTNKLAENQVGKIHRLCTLPGWNIHRLEADKVYEEEKSSSCEGEAKEEVFTGEKAYEELVLRRGLEIVKEFLEKDDDGEVDDSDHLSVFTTTTTDGSASDDGVDSGAGVMITDSVDANITTE